jgi:Ni/Fe-hydrogenase subunit HybB-like protein
MGRRRKDGGQDLRFKGASKYESLPPFFYTLAIPIILGLLILWYDLGQYNVIFRSTNFVNDIALVWWTSVFIPIYFVFVYEEVDEEIAELIGKKSSHLTLKKFLIYCFGFLFLLESIAFFFPNL